MPLSKRIMAVGASAELAKATNGQFANLPAGVGTTQAGATAISADINVIVTSSAGNTAFILPNDAITSDSLDIMTASGITASALIYPPVGGTINGGGTNASITMAAGTSATFWCTANLTWLTNPKTPS
jgi:hypothetical protein